MLLVEPASGVVVRVGLEVPARGRKAGVGVLVAAHQLGVEADVEVLDRRATVDDGEARHHEGVRRLQREAERALVDQDLERGVAFLLVAVRRARRLVGVPAVEILIRDRLGRVLVAVQDSRALDQVLARGRGLALALGVGALRIVHDRARDVGDGVLHRDPADPQPGARHVLVAVAERELEGRVLVLEVGAEEPVVREGEPDAVDVGDRQRVAHRVGQDGGRRRRAARRGGRRGGQGEPEGGEHEPPAPHHNPVTCRSYSSGNSSMKIRSISRFTSRSVRAFCA